VAAQDDQRATEWQNATAEFLNTPEGRNWDGSPNKLALMGWLLQTNGLESVEDKVGALQAVAIEMHNRGLDVVPEQKTNIAADASPAEIIEKWKAGYGSPQAAGEAFRKFFTK
jgi:hypothetical protein